MPDNTQKITPNLWFDTQAKQAAEFYTALFPNSKITYSTTLRNTPSGDCDIISFTLGDHPFMAISAGPMFKINPSISFILNFDPSTDPDAQKHLDMMWLQFSEGGKVLMPLDKYDFSPHYGWVQDKFGVSWQLLLTDPDSDKRPFIVPSLMFVGEVCGKAEEATNFYLSVFKNSERGQIARYPKGMEPDKEGAIMFTDFRLLDTWLAAMDSAHEHKFSFTEAISLAVTCETQAEIDYYWEKLSAVPESEQCGWLKDKYGVSWQITPQLMDEMMSMGTPAQIDRVTQAFLPMKKIEIEKLQQAFEGG